MEENDVNLVEPNKNNLHDIFAIQNSIILDIVIGKYTKENPCTVYNFDFENGEIFHL